MARDKTPIDQPGPVKTEPRDLAALKRLLVECGPPTFDGAVRGKQFGLDDRRIICEAAQRYGYAYPHQSLTLACAAYWKMFDEKGES